MARRRQTIRPELSAQVLISAYASGAFPMPDPDAPGELLWFSPDPRCLLPLDDRFHVARRLAWTIRRGRYVCTLDRDFRGVMLGCAARPEGTWISDDFLAAYCRLHELGLAHSVEAWEAGDPGRLVGGVYGVSIKGAFFAESMFHRATDAGKVALVRLVGHLRGRGFLMCDVQWRTANLARLGAIELSRRRYLALLSKALGADVTW